MTDDAAAEAPPAGGSAVATSARTFGSPRAPRSAPYCSAASHSPAPIRPGGCCSRWPHSVLLGYTVERSGLPAAAHVVARGPHRAQPVRAPGLHLAGGRPGARRRARAVRAAGGHLEIDADERLLVLSRRALGARAGGRRRARVGLRRARSARERLSTGGAASVKKRSRCGRARRPARPPRRRRVPLAAATGEPAADSRHPADRRQPADRRRAAQPTTKPPMCPSLEMLADREGQHEVQHDDADQPLRVQAEAAHQHQAGTEAARRCAPDAPTTGSEPARRTA